MNEDAHAKESFRQAMWDAWYDWLATDEAGIPSKAEQCVQFFAKRGWQEIAALRKRLAERDSELKALERVNAEQTEELKHLKEWIEHLNKNPD